MNNKSFVVGAIIGGITASAAAFMATSKKGEALLDAARRNTSKALELIETVQKEGITLKTNLEDSKKAEQRAALDEMKTSIEKMKKELEPHQDKLKSDMDRLEGRLSSLHDSTSFRFNWTFYFFNQTNNND